LCVYASCVSHVWNFGCLRQDNLTSRSVYRFCTASGTAAMDLEDISEPKEFVVDRWVLHDVNDRGLSFSSDTIIRCPDLQQGTLARLDKNMLANSVPRTAAERESNQLSPPTATNRNRTRETKRSYCDNSTLVLRQLGTRTATTRHSYCDNSNRMRP